MVGPRLVAGGAAFALLGGTFLSGGCDDAGFELPGNVDGGADHGHLAHPVACEDGVADGAVEVGSDTELEALRG